jgi:hypothetical protein
MRGRRLGRVRPRCSHDREQMRDPAPAGPIARATFSP